MFNISLFKFLRIKILKMIQPENNCYLVKFIVFLYIPKFSNFDKHVVLCNGKKVKFYKNEE